jgi:hypothetical protein
VVAQGKEGRSVARGTETLLQRPIQKVGRVVLSIAGWFSAAFAVVGGTLAIGTPIGDFVRTVIGFTKGWAPIVVIIALVVGIVLSVIDIAADGTPNQWVVITGALAPSVSSAFPTGLGQGIVDFGRWLTEIFNRWLFTMAGNQTTFALSLACLVAAGVIAVAVLSKSGTGSRVVMRG